MTPNTLGNGEIIKIDPPEGELPTEMQGYVAREPVAYDGETIPTTEPMPDPSEPTHPGFEEALGAVRATMPTEKRQLNFTVNVVGLDKNSLSEPFLNSMLARLSNDNNGVTEGEVTITATPSANLTNAFSLKIELNGEFFGNLLATQNPETDKYEFVTP
ncbi:MAG: hypothetical protein UV80_C0002G0119 [Candidatus Peregrinibacteria bacterium GW2011_GWF2_43_17]|nr:MAG: hypothetical protein UV80_C0002G0119 [Candidatus Peregrinibacteria bacterium GW2011_GWF2_43_17]KKT18534.1 MAG: hypothetical protein UW03_C0039G0007 [Candidatus Peregrinibacteria bacterium GW2011_GWA2_43_8]HAU39837.1 hypothetical protein [Candidatus Peregrinibacteria bacterium]